MWVFWEMVLVDIGELFGKIVLVWEVVEVDVVINLVKFKIYS